MFDKTNVGVFFVSVFVALFAQNTYSQSEPASGRTADGRAYRTDSQGVVMIDYIAELELETDSLRRQVQGLESEIEELRSSSSSGRKESVAVAPKIECPVTTCPEKICPEPKVCPVIEPVVQKEFNDCSQEAKLITELESQVQKFSVKEQELTDKLNLATLQLNAFKQREEKVLAENQSLRKQATTLASLNVNKVPQVAASNPVLEPKLPNKNLVDSRNELICYRALSRKETLSINHSNRIIPE
jgi:TolA-binding protein